MAWRHLKWDVQSGQPSGLPCLLWQAVCPLPCSWVQPPQACLCCCVPSETVSPLHYSPLSWHPDASDGREKGRAPAERSPTTAGGSDRDVSVAWAAPGSCCPLASSWHRVGADRLSWAGPLHGEGTRWRSPMRCHRDGDRTTSDGARWAPCLCWLKPSQCGLCPHLLDLSCAATTARVLSRPCYPGTWEDPA